MKPSSISPPLPPLTANCSLYREALVNLTTSAATDRKLLTTLATTIANINDHIQHLNKPPIATVNNSEATNSTALSLITSSVTGLQQQLADLKRENKQLRNKQTQRPRTRHDNRNYCWTHGHCVGNKHTSATCQNKAPGHQDNATCENTMGGREANKPTMIQFPPKMDEKWLRNELLN